MIKKLVLVFIAFIAIQSYAQQGTASPYSFYGIGALKFKGTVENRSMGGLSIYTDSIHVNLRNPASYAGPNVAIFPYNKESRPVTFSVGGSHSSVKLKSDSSSESAATSSFDYVAISIPLNKFGVGFGVMPHTAVGYKLETTTDDGKVFEPKNYLGKIYHYGKIINYTNSLSNLDTLSYVIEKTISIYPNAPIYALTDSIEPKPATLTLLTFSASI